MSKGSSLQRNSQKIHVLAHLGMGGHTSQMLRLLEKMGHQEYQYSFLIGSDDQNSQKRTPFSGKFYPIKNPRLMSDSSLLLVFFKMFPATIQAWKVLRQVKPDVLISAGPAPAIPTFWLAKCLGIKTIFIESWVRVEHGSLTGKLVYPVSDLFFVQWKQLKTRYPKAIYAGRLS